jgi:hypothetical protein
MEGGWGLGSVRVGIVFYRNGYFVVVEDAALSVKRGGTPTHHKWGSGGSGSSQAQIFKVKPLDNP